MPQEEGEIPGPDNFIDQAGRARKEEAAQSEREQIGIPLLHGCGDGTWGPGAGNLFGRGGCGPWG